MRLDAQSPTTGVTWLLLLVSAQVLGCGIPLTADAVPCGEHSTGMEIWSDSKGMTCEQAMTTVAQAIAILRREHRGTM